MYDSLSLTDVDADASTLTSVVDRVESVEPAADDPPDYESLSTLYPNLGQQHSDQHFCPSAPSLPPVLPDPTSWKLSNKQTKASIHVQRLYLDILNNEITWTDGDLDPKEVVEKFAEHFGSDWHCIFGTLNFSLACDDESLMVLKQMGRHLIIFKRETRTSVKETVDISAEFQRIGLKFMTEDKKKKFPNSWVYKKKWTGENVKIDKILEEKFGGSWICLEGKVDGFSYASSNARQHEMCVINDNNDMFCVWLA